MVGTVCTSGPELDTTLGELVFRVCGPTRRGQTVRLRSAKCTIGSGSRCTLRLRARGVRPLHCLILRGVGGTVVRRWSPDTRLNGQAFTDAELAPGDRLSVGAIELEVIDSGQTSEQIATPAEQTPLPAPSISRPAETTTPTRPSTPDNRQLDELSSRLALANRLGRQRARQLIERLRAADREIVQLSRQTEQIVSLREQLQHQQEVAEQLRRQQQAVRDETEKRLAEQAEQMNLLREELQREKEAAEELRKKQAKREETEEELSEQAEKAELLREELQREREAAEQLRRQQQAERDQIEQKLAEQAEEMDLLREELQRQREAAEQLRQQHAEREETEEELSEQAEQMDLLQEELQRQREAFEQLQQQQSADDETEKKQAEQAEQMNLLREQLQREREVAEQLRQQQQAQRDETTEQLNQQAEQLDVLRGELQREREVSAQLRRQLEAEHAPTDAEQIDRAAGPPSPQEAGPDETSDESMVELSDIFGAVESVDLLDDGGQQEEPTGEAVAGSSPSTAPEPEDEDEDEESIDQYMNRLLQRVRASVGGQEQVEPKPPPAQLPESTEPESRVGYWTPPQEPVPIVDTSSVQAEQQTESEPESPPGEPLRPESDDLSPRAIAPEKHIDLSAMREVANVSARTALERHSLQQKTSAKRANLYLSVVAFLAGGALLAIWWRRGGSDLTLYAAIVNFVVALLWGVKYLRLALQIMINKSAKWKMLAHGDQDPQDGNAPEQ